MRKPASAFSVSPWVAWPAVGLAAGAGGAAAGLLATWLLPRGHELVWEWKLRRDIVLPLPWTIPGSVCLLLLALITADLLRGGKTPSRLVCGVMVACLTLGSGSLMLCMALDDRDFPLRSTAVLLGDMSMGYYVQGTRVSDVRGYVRDVALRTDLRRVPERVATHPPGPVMYYWLARRWLLARPGLLAGLQAAQERWAGDPRLVGTVTLSRRVSTIGPTGQDAVLAFWPGMALTLVAPLAVPLLFGMGTLALDRRVGLLAAVLGSAVPSLVCFMPSVDGMAAVLGGAVLLCWLWALRSGVGLPGLMGGALWMVGLFWSFALVALGLPMAATGLMWWGDGGSRRDLKPALAGVVLGMVLVGLGGYVALGYDPMTSMVRSLAAQQQVMELTHRPYRLSVVWNLYEYGLFAGPSLVVMAVVGTLVGLGRGWRPRVVSGLGWGVIFTVVALCLAGRTRGEVGRIWGFLMPPLAVPAAAPLMGLRGWGLISAAVLVLAGELALAVAMYSHWALVTP